MCNCNCKNALNTVTTTPTPVAINGFIPFNQNNIIVGQSIRHSDGSTVINFIRNGVYLVNFYASVSTSGVSGNVVVKMQRANVDVPGATVTTNSTAVTDIKSISFSTIVRVSNACAYVNGTNAIPIQFVNTGVAATFTNVGVTITEVK